MNEYIGWIGAFFFAICALPQAIKVFKTKKADDLSWLFLIFWLLGEIFTLTYLLIDDIKLGITHFPIYINYVFNLLILAYLLYAKKAYSKNEIIIDKKHG